MIFIRKYKVRLEREEPRKRIYIYIYTIAVKRTGYVAVLLNYRLSLSRVVPSGREREREREGV